MVSNFGSLLRQSLCPWCRLSPWRRRSRHCAGPTPLDQEGPSDPITPEQNTSEREARDYPEQPPLIPHSIEGYEVSIRGNKCLSCHARAAFENLKRR